MERFKIYAILYPSTTEERRVLLTNSENLSSAATFDERFSLGKNDKSSLSFSMSETLDNGLKNPYLGLLRPESVVAIDLLDRQPVHDSVNRNSEGLFIKYKIKSRQPIINKEMSTWEFQCEDYASAVYSKEAQGLSIDKTGTLQELAEEILGVSRKNISYENLNINLVKDFVNHNAKSLGFIINPPYTTYSKTDMSIFTKSNPEPFKRFYRHNKMKTNETYDLRFDLINSSFTPQVGDVAALNMDITIRQIDAAGLGLAVSQPYRLNNNTPEVPTIINIPFELAANTAYIDVMINERTDKLFTSYGIGKFDISAVNFQITKNKDFLLELDNTDPLHLNNLQNLNNFISYMGTIGYQDTKMTFVVDNSNLYNALIELATLFEAEVRFDYEDNAFYFISVKHNKFRGYRLDPEVNLLSINRPESSSDFASILHLRGSEDVNSIIPPLPQEWRDYFLECVENKFSTVEYFSKYGTGGKTYTQIANEIILPKIKGYNNFYERKNEILKFAAQMDRAPNFDGTLYDFRYFLDTHQMTQMQYNSLIKMLYDDIRKINITANIKSYQYYTLFSKYTEQQTQMAYYILNINNEQKFQLTSGQKLNTVLNPNAPKPYTSAWLSLKNQIDNSQSVEQDAIDSLEEMLGYNNDLLYIGEESFIFNIMHLFGYESKTKNGLTYLLEENRKAIDEKMKEQTDLEKQVVGIQIRMHINTHGHAITYKNLLAKSVINNGVFSQMDVAETEFLSNITNKNRKLLIDYVVEDKKRYETLFGMVAENPLTMHFENDALQVDLSGLQRRLTRTYDFLGLRDGTLLSYEGTLNIERRFLSKLMDSFSAYDNPFPPTESLYDTLFNKEYPNNIIVQKESKLETLYQTWESFAIEGVYENSDEIDSYGLLEQGLKAFVYFSKPKIEFSFSTIEIGAIDNYRHLPLVEVGEKILLRDDLYYSYHDEETKYLIVTEYNLSLRDPSSLSMRVVQDDETERLVRELLKSVNLVKIEPFKQKSNLVLPVPSELKNLYVAKFYNNQNKEEYTETLEIISNNRSLFRDMFIKETDPGTINTARL